MLFQPKHYVRGDNDDDDKMMSIMGLRNDHASREKGNREKGGEWRKGGKCSKEKDFSLYTYSLNVGVEWNIK